MGKKNNIIEINGTRYDARTGTALGGHPPTPVKAAHHSAAHTGIPLRKSSSARSITVHHEDHPDQPKPAKKPFIHDAAKPPVKATSNHAPQHSKTLMRSAVKKPAHSLKRRVKAYGSTDTLLKHPALTVHPKPSASSLDAKRLKHARDVKKSKLIKRFDHRQAAIAIPVTLTKPQQPAAIQPAAPVVRPPSKRPATTADLLQHALRHATSHQEAPPKLQKRHGFSRRITSISAITLAVVVLAGFVAFQNLTNVRVHVASAKAGFAANLPSDQPAGYHLSNLRSSPGTVAFNFQSNSDGRKFAITEKASDWDSGTLRDTFVATSGQNYQTVQSAGRILYLYGKNAATWVNGGVWYQVHTNGSLSSRQLVDLATSM